MGLNLNLMVHRLHEIRKIVKILLSFQFQNLRDKLPPCKIAVKINDKVHNMHAAITLRKTAVIIKYKRKYSFAKYLPGVIC